MDDFPASPALRTLLATWVVTGDNVHFGAGTLTDPFLRTPVKLIGEDGNAVRIITAIERAARAYLTEASIRDERRHRMLTALREELKSSPSYDDLLYRAQCLVQVY